MVLWDMVYAVDAASIVLLVIVLLVVSVAAIFIFGSVIFDGFNCEIPLYQYKDNIKFFYTVSTIPLPTAPSPPSPPIEAYIIAIFAS